MKIRSCEINNFGKLSGRNIELSDGINVIRGKNESGKSTLSVFMKYALYGYAGKGRDEKNNEKIKYTPWNGQKSAGALVIEDENGETYRVERSSDSKGSKCRIYDSTGTQCYEGLEAGEVFFGIDSAGFSKSTFVGQNDIQPEDIKDIGASLEKLLLESNSDDTDFDKAVKSLSSDKNKLCNKTRTSGRIVELSEEIAQLRYKREEQSKNNRLLNASVFAVSETEKNLNVSNAHLEKLYAEFENIEAYRASELLERIEIAKEKYSASEKAHRELVESYSVNGFVPDRRFVDELTRLHSEFISVAPEYISAKREYEDSVKKFENVRSGMHDGNKFDDSIEQDRSKVFSVLDTAKTLAAAAGRFKVLAIVFLCLILTIPVSVVMFVLSSKKKKQLAALLAEYGFSDIRELESFCGKYTSLFEALGQCRDDVQRRKSVYEDVKIRCAACEEMLYAKLLKLGYVDSREAMGARLGDIRDRLIPDLCAAVSESERIYSEYSKEKNAYEALMSVSDPEQLRELAAKKKDEPPTRSREEVERAIKYDEGAGKMLSQRLANLRTETARLEATVTDPAEIENEIFRLESELSEASLHYDALELAAELMASARDEIRGNVFPQISGRASELFSRFSSGKYRGLFFDKDFVLKVLENGDTEMRRSGFLSSGTSDAAYIALRVALSEHLCKNRPPIVFDDSFVKIDDERLANILGVLQELSSDYQIIILTCHDREEKLLGSNCRVTVLDENDTE